MKITRNSVNEETVITVEGCLDTAASDEFASALDAAEGVKTLVLDFHALDFIASSGLRSLVAAAKRAKAAGNTIVLSGMNEVVADVFDVTGLMSEFVIR